MMLKGIDSDKNACIFNNWYEKFKKLSIKSETIQIPDEVLAYLRDNLLILPKECRQEEVSNSQEVYHFNQFNDNFDENDDDDDVVQPEFVNFSAQLTQTIRALGGSAFLKTDWHCPKDAVWITPGQTLRIRDITDLYQLLKASSFCKDDLAPRKFGNEYYIVLKKWMDIHPGTEFRCFVKNKSLIAISPRDWPSFHEHIANERSDIIGDIVSVYKENIKGKFPATDYVFDVIRNKKDSVILMDFCPFGRDFCDSLAFDWDLLTLDADEEEDEPEFRYLPSDCGIQPSRRSNYGVPEDILNVFKTNAEDPTMNDSSIINRLVEEVYLQGRETDNTEDT